MWKAVFVVLGAMFGGVVVWFGSWPGLALFGVLEGDAKGGRYAIAIGVLVFSLLGFWRGSALDARRGCRTPPQKWQAVFAVLGAVVGYIIGWIGFSAVLAAIGLRDNAMYAIAFLVGIPVAGAAFSLVGLRFGSVLDGRSQHNASPQKWKQVLTTLGTATGPFIGYYCVHSLVYVSMGGDCWRGFFAGMHGLAQGVPTGGILLCLLGLCLGSALDERSRRKDSPIEDSGFA